MKLKALLAALAALVAALALSACVLGSANLVIDIRDAHAYNSSASFAIDGYLTNNGTVTAHNVRGDYFIHDSLGVVITNLVETSSSSYPAEIPPGSSVWIHIEGYTLAPYPYPRQYTMTVTHQDWSGNTVTVTRHALFSLYYP